MAPDDVKSPREITIEPVESAAQWRDFFELRRFIYRDDPAAVMPLRSMERLQLDTERHPFYQHAQRQAYLACNDGKPVGRIVAVKDDMHNSFYNDTVGFFGFFETIDNQIVADQLFRVAQSWLEKNGCTVMRGPVNPSMKSDFGVLIEGYESVPYVMMGHTPVYYEDLFREGGFTVAKKFFAYKFNQITNYVDVREKWAAVTAADEKIQQRFPQLEFRCVEPVNFEKTLRDINELGNQVRSSNYGFVPLTEEELVFMISQMRRIIRMETIFVAYWEDQLVGFIVNLPDLNWALKQTRGRFDWIRMPQLLYWLKKTKRSRVIALGVHEDFRKKGIAIALMKRLIDLSEDYEEWEFSWVVEDNIKSIRAIGRTMPLIKHKVYHLFERPIDNQLTGNGK